MHSEAFKQDLIGSSLLLLGASVSALVVQAAINANLLFKWPRMQVRAPREATASSPDHHRC